MNRRKLNSKLKLRIKRRDRQEKRWKKTHDAGHARAARREAKAVRFLRHLIRQLPRPTRSPKRMFDSVTVTEIPHIPATAAAVAGYVGGIYHTMPALRRVFPKSRKVSIAVESSEHADFLDVELGDATPADCPAWFRRQKERKAKTIGFYASVSTMQEIIDVLKGAGIERSEYKVWTAHYAGKHVCGKHTCGYPTFHGEADGTQWTSSSMGRNLDESMLLPSFW